MNATLEVVPQTRRLTLRLDYRHLGGFRFCAVTKGGRILPVYCEHRGEPTYTANPEKRGTVLHTVKAEWLMGKAEARG